MHATAHTVAALIFWGGLAIIALTAIAIYQAIQLAKQPAVIYVNRHQEPDDHGEYDSAWDDMPRPTNPWSNAGDDLGYVDLTFEPGSAAYIDRWAADELEYFTQQ